MTKLTTDQLKEIKAEMVKKHFKYRQSNGIHNFVNAAIKEGIEVKGDSSINPFWVAPDESREYGYSLTGNETRAAVSIIEQILMEEGQPVYSNEQQQNDAKEQMALKQEVETKEADIVLKEDKQLYGIVPKYLTDELIARHPGTIPMLISMQKTDPNMIKTREKGLKYVDTAYMTVALNLATLMDWSFEVLESREDVIDKKKHFSVLGCLTIHTTEGKDIMKQQWGSQVLKAKMEVGDALKAAASDSMKKCASMLGIAADVYAGAV